MQYGVVLDTGGDDMVAFLLQSKGSTFERSVVRLGAAAGEDDLCRFAT